MKRILLLFALIFSLTFNLQAITTTLMWNASTNKNVTGYFVYCSTMKASFNPAKLVFKTYTTNNSFVPKNLPKGDLYFMVTEANTNLGFQYAWPSTNTTVEGFPSSVVSFTSK